jgi:manganese oxidase
MAKRVSMSATERLPYVRAAAGAALTVSLSLLVVVFWLLDPNNVPKGVSDFLYRNIGERPFESAPLSLATPRIQPETPCNDEHADWRPAQTIDGVAIAEERSCEPHNPFEVAAFVKGTNNISEETLKRTGLSKDAVEKCCGDDPNEVHVRLEVSELNGRSPDLMEPLPRFEVAPGLNPAFWVFTPKARGMSTENFETTKAAPLLRMPAPTIRVAVGNHVKITLENGHYLPHSIHLHGVDHPYESHGAGNDGVPGVDQIAVAPGKSKTYELSPRVPGTFMYHCHVQTHAHFMMGLVGILIVEPKVPNTLLQTLNPGAGFVRHSSKAISTKYNREYDLLYSDVESEMHDMARTSNDPRVVSEKLHQGYRPAEHRPDIFLLNGRAFPYTLREDLLIVKPNENIKLHILNAGAGVRAVHPHGHMFKVTQRNGGDIPEGGQHFEDIAVLATGERVEADLNTTDDGLRSTGEGAWVLHDHVEEGQTRGVDPGGDLTVIAYESYLTAQGLPKLAGDPSAFFTKEYYEGRIPTFAGLENKGLLGAPDARVSSGLRLFLIAMAPLLTGAAIGSLALLGSGLASAARSRFGRRGRKAFAAPGE